MKKLSKSDFKVVVYPKTEIYGIKVAEEESVCEQIVSDIKRHVNDIQSVEIVRDDYYVCGYCGGSWTEDGETFNGGCCDEDMDAAEAGGIVQ